MGFNWPLWPRRQEKKITSIDDTVLEGYRVISFNQPKIKDYEVPVIYRELCEYLGYEGRRSKNTRTDVDYCFDFTGVTEFSGLGLAAMVFSLRYLRAKGKHLCVLNASGRVKAALDLTGLDRVFGVYNSIEELPKPNLNPL